MIANKIKRLWADGKVVQNGWLSLPGGFGAELAAAQDYDAITIDLQHGLIDAEQMLIMLQAMRASGVTPLVRVPWLDPAVIMKALDSGAYGVICPMINTRADAETLVSYMRYPPHGLRSFGPIRASISAGPNYASEANTEILTIAMIETREGFDNLEEIVSTPGLDAILVGPSDLAIGLSGGRLAPGLDREEPEMIEAFQRIATACRAAGLHAIFLCLAPAYAARAVGWGYDMVGVGNDVRFLTTGAQAMLAETRRLIGG